MKRNLALFFILYLFSFLSPIFAQEEFKYFGSPFIEQYLPKEYAFAAQNWAITQDQRGFMYFGNTGGLLEFDGVNWRRYRLPNLSAIRSLTIDSTNKIWIGASNEFGWFEPDSLGDLKYSSLSKKLPDSLLNFKKIWKTIASPRGVYFFSKKKIFRWYNEKIEIINTNLRSTNAAKVDDKIYIIHHQKGICLLKDTLSIPLLNDKQIQKLGKGYLSICQYKKNQLLIITKYEGFFLYDSETREFSSLKTDPKIKEYLAKNTGAYSLSRIDDTTFAAGTFTGGVLVFDAQLKLTDVVNTMRGMPNNCVYGLFTDKDGMLWAALQNGIAQIDIKNPIRTYGEKQNMNAYILDVIYYDNKKYISTMNGCFFLEKHSLSSVDDNHIFQNIPELTNAWDLEIYKNKLLVSGFFGLAQIIGNKSKILFDRNTEGEKGGNIFAIRNTKKFPNHLFLGYSNAFAVVELRERNNSNYLEVKKAFFFPEITSEVRNIAVDKQGDLWLGMHDNGVAYIRFNDGNDISNYDISFFNINNGLPTNDEEVTVIFLDEEIKLLTSKGVYITNRKNKQTKIDSLTQFKQDSFWGTYLNNNSIRLSGLFKLKEDFYIAEGDLLGFVQKKGNTTVINQAPFVKVSGVNRLTVSDDYLNLCTNNSFHTYNLTKDSLKTNKPYQTFIRKVTIAQDSLIFNGSFYTRNGTEFAFSQVQLKEQIPEIKHSHDAMRFHFSTNFFERTKQTKYSYLLKGFGEKWSNWTAETQAVFTNLPEGDYTFEVKARNIYEMESSIGNYKFKILAPWYRTFYAYFIYFLLLAGLLWAIVKFNARRHIQDKKKLEAIIKERTQKIQEHEDEIVAQNEELLQANEEINATSDVLGSQNKKLEKAYTDVQLLNQVGQKITSKLSIKDIIETVYENVNTLMEAEVFSIGIFNPSKNTLDFHGTKEKGEILDFHYNELSNKNSLSAFCFNNSVDILIYNFNLDIYTYLDTIPEIIVGELPKSLIYLPLGTPEKKIGVISVQSFENESYTEYHLNILKNIGIYTSIALENTESYSQIQKQHYEIKSSVKYASTIQNAMLPSKRHIDSLLQNFILYRPKDIVSGDFYWVSKVEDAIFVAVVDCTGHGVPGAFMSMIGSRLLNEIINEKKTLETDAILEKLNSGIKKVLRQEQTDNTDGMDICLCRIEKNELGAEITFSGSKNSLFVYQSKKAELSRIRGDRKAIGGNYFQDMHFTQTKISLQKGDVIYLTTDGFIDQNNKERKKYSTRRLMRYLNEIGKKVLSLQKKDLDNELDNWQGMEEQRDDITIMGVRI